MIHRLIKKTIGGSRGFSQTLGHPANRKFEFYNFSEMENHAKVFLSPSGTRKFFIQQLEHATMVRDSSGKSSKKYQYQGNQFARVCIQVGQGPECQKL